LALKKNLDVLVFEKIRDRIINSEWEQGQNLDIDELARFYEVSRTPVLQALKRMQAEGIVVVSGTGKYFFPKYSIKQVRDICSVRLVLELEALREIQRKEGKVETVSLMETAQQCRRVMINGNVTVSRQLDLQWHKDLIGLTRNECLIQLYIQVQSQFMVANYLQAFHSSAQQLVAADDHINILTQLSQNDFDGAMEILETHIMLAAEKIVSRINT